MSRRFTPDERCLGGVQEIHADYTNMRRKLLNAKPQVPIPADLQPAHLFFLVPEGNTATARSRAYFTMR